MDFATSLATRCHSSGSQPSADATRVVSWRRCTNAGRWVRPRLATNSASGSTKRQVLVLRVTEHAAGDELVPVTQNAVWQSASPNTAKMRFAIGMNADASRRGGRITRQRWNIVDQSSSVRVTPFGGRELQRRDRDSSPSSSSEERCKNLTRRLRARTRRQKGRTLMGEIVRFPSNGTDGQGYLAVPESGSGTGRCRAPGVVGAERRRSRKCATASRRKGSSPSRPTSTAARSRPSPTRPAR